MSVSLHALSRTSAVVLVCSTALGAQSAPVRTLGKPLATSTSQFALVNTVRELNDGSVFVADPLSGDLWLLPASLKEGKQLGREGSGPGEFRQPDAVWALRGDTTALVDLGNARISLLDAKGTFVRSMSMVLGDFNPGGPGGPPPIMTPQGTDDRGRVYFQGIGMGPGGPSDSIKVMRYDPATKKLDTVATVKGPTLSRQESGSANSREVRIRPVPLATGDGWAVTRGGAIALVRVNPYRLDVITPAGQKSSGPTVSYDRVRIGSGEKDEWVADQQLRGGISLQVENRDGQVSMSMSRARGNRPNLEGLTFPEYKPPFENGTLVVDPMGRAWVRRHLPAKQPARYDVFDASGKLIAAVNLPTGRRVVGFGKASLYIVALDNDGLATLERYAIPAL